ncbi:MAG: hypothetical protein CMP22_04825 [Rickettsiales bacterium]|nr:hypothetical protein [Rickettsiales bacterium]
MAIDKKKRPIIILYAVVLVLLAVFVLSAEYVFDNDNPNSSKQAETSSMVEGIAGLKLGGEYELMSHDGVMVTNATYHDKPRLMFFGFTYCPDICPTELAMITRVLNDMDEEKTEDLKVLFVSVDPERDTPEQLKEYLSLFHPKIEGLTGSEEQVEHVKNLFKVYSSKVFPEDGNDYTVDHSAFLYFFDADNQLVAMLKHGATEKDLKSVLSKHL